MQPISAEEFIAKLRSDVDRIYEEHHRERIRKKQKYEQESEHASKYEEQHNTLLTHIPIHQKIPINQKNSVEIRYQEDQPYYEQETNVLTDEQEYYHVSAHIYEHEENIF